VDTFQLRQQQITLGLLKAARVLCSRQDNLRQILSHQAGSTDGSSTFSLQHLMCSAIKPSPIKALFDREELEVCVGIECVIIQKFEITLYVWKILKFLNSQVSRYMEEAQVLHTYSVNHEELGARNLD